VRSSSARSSGIKGKARPSLFFVEPRLQRHEAAREVDLRARERQELRALYLGTERETSRCRGPIVREGGRADNGGSVNWAFVPSMLR
jgi:hypothetical protein